MAKSVDTAILGVGVLALLMMAGTNHAEPIVIKDYGGTRASGVPGKADLDAFVREQKTKRPNVRFNPYPVRSAITAGELDGPIAHKLPVVQPFFILGDDDFSVSWAQKNKQYLLHSGAQGYATNLATEAAFKRLKAELAPLPLAPMTVDEIAQILHIPHYPVLITAQKADQ